MDITLQSLQYHFCDKNNHHEELSLVCLERKCNDDALICGVCQAQNHNGHTTVPLRTFLKDISLMNDQTTIKLALNLQNDLTKLKEKFKSQLVRIREEFINCTYELQTKVNSYFSQLDDKYYQSFQKKSQKHIAQALNTAFQNQRSGQLAALINQIKEYNQVSLQDQIHFYKISTERKLEGFLQSMKKLNFKDELKRIESTLILVAQPFDSFSYQWSNLKPPSISINGNIATQKHSNSAAQRFALIQPKNKVYGDIKIKFRIAKLKGWIGLGICLRQKIVKAGYKFNYTLPQHGSYLISANGYCWSHSRPQYNSAYKSFVFHEGDTISVNYNVLDRQVTFESKLTNSKFYLSTIDCPPDDCYVPCANLCNSGDEVEIINELND